MRKLVAVYCVHEGEALLVHHKKHDLRLPVGGKIRDNETPFLAALRELEEETGWKSEDLRPAVPIRSMVPFGYFGYREFERQTGAFTPIGFGDAGAMAKVELMECCFQFAFHVPNRKPVSNGEWSDPQWFSIANFQSLVPHNVPTNVRFTMAELREEYAFAQAIEVGA